MLISPPAPCVVAFTLAIYALPFMLRFAAVRFAYDTGPGLLGPVTAGLPPARPPGVDRHLMARFSWQSKVRDSQPETRYGGVENSWSERDRVMKISPFEGAGGRTWNGW
jgi:hypothetical protein